MSVPAPNKIVFALIIEDDKDSARLYGRILKSLDIPYDSAHTREAGLEQLGVVAPELVMLDLKLVDKTGYDILQKLRTDPHYSQTRVIIITGYPELYDQLRNKVDYIFLKPINARDLSDIIQKLVRLPQP